MHNKRVKILITAFEPFQGDSINSSAEAIKGLEARIGDAEVKTRVLPASFSKAPEVLAKALKEENADIVVCFGQIAGRPHVSLERIASNLIDDFSKDNEGVSIQNKKVTKKGPDAYFSTLPLDRLREKLLENGVPATISNNSQNFVCNQVFYTLMHHAKTKGRIKAAGFVHLPALPRQAAEQYKKMPTKTVATGVPSMDAGTQRKAVKIIIETLSDFCK
ncbi:pyroglutamyl-peptidase I [Candidatus Micrarchaeota archaeon]|nr:pyroglutamyl-peptidase I [Candidatus Micrarchaeota archaeon]